jgi:hypothetical protein
MENYKPTSQEMFVSMCGLILSGIVFSSQGFWPAVAVFGLALVVFQVLHNATVWQNMAAPKNRTDCPNETKTSNRPSLFSSRWSDCKAIDNWSVARLSLYLSAIIGFGATLPIEVGAPVWDIFMSAAARSFIPVFFYISLCVCLDTLFFGRNREHQSSSAGKIYPLQNRQQAMRVGLLYWTGFALLSAARARTALLVSGHVAPVFDLPLFLSGLFVWLPVFALLVFVDRFLFTNERYSDDEYNDGKDEVAIIIFEPTLERVSCGAGEPFSDVSMDRHA